MSRTGLYLEQLLLLDAITPVNVRSAVQRASGDYFCMYETVDG
jgi:hypothetical protein